jgi:hypothetical protein
MEKNAIISGSRLSASCLDGAVPPWALLPRFSQTTHLDIEQLNNYWFMREVCQNSPNLTLPKISARLSLTCVTLTTTLGISSTFLKLPYMMSITYVMYIESHELTGRQHGCGLTHFSFIYR